MLVEISFPHHVPKSKRGIITHSNRCICALGRHHDDCHSFCSLLWQRRCSCHSCQPSAYREYGLKPWGGYCLVEVEDKRLKRYVAPVGFFSSFFLLLGTILGRKSSVCGIPNPLERQKFLQCSHGRRCRRGSRCWNISGGCVSCNNRRGWGHASRRQSC